MVPEAEVGSLGPKIKQHRYIAPRGLPQAFVDPGFRKTILLHIAKNHIPDLKTALILAIQGKAGEGKSFQVREACSQAGVNLVPLAGASLSGSYEGEAVSVLADAYCFASALRETTDTMTVLVVDDFDLSVAATIDDRRYTVNTQLLTGFLMNLADDPRRCGDRATSRVPIVVTGNNFRALHGPLIRHGRMNFFEWSPSFDQKVEIVKYIFSGVLPRDDAAKISKLVQKFDNQPISFFSALKDDLIDAALSDSIDAGALSVKSFEKAVANSLKGQSLERLMQLGHARDRRSARDFL